ncbi:MAG: alpha/beta hydrolase [Dehalococcoidia bacterium]
MDRRGQKWVLDTLLGMFGIDVLHPESRPIFVQLGYGMADVERVMQRLKGGDWTLKAYTTRAVEVERMACRAEEEGQRLTARDLYLRAGLLYGRAQYAIFRDDPIKSAYHGKLVECFQKVMALNSTPIERVEIPLDGSTVYAVLHLPADTSHRVPAVLLVPGMDMVKEEWTAISLRCFLERGMATLAIDGPGQGETLLHGLKVTVDNYERAAQAAIDYLAARPDIDADRIGMFGVSMGSHWGTRIAAAEARLKAAATAMGCYGPKDTIFNWAQPSYRANYKYMAGIYDEDEFDRMAAQMVLDSVAPQVRCPFLMLQGEFDELSPLHEVLPIYELVRAPKEVWVYEDQFHPLGGVFAEAVAGVADWLLARLNGLPLPSSDRRLYIRTDGTVVEGDARPLWWSPERLLPVAART